SLVSIPGSQTTANCSGHEDSVAQKHRVRLRPGLARLVLGDGPIFLGARLDDDQLASGGESQPDAAGVQNRRAAFISLGALPKRGPAFRVKAEEKAASAVR